MASFATQIPWFLFVEATAAGTATTAAGVTFFDFDVTDFVVGHTERKEWSRFGDAIDWTERLACHRQRQIDR